MRVVRAVPASGSAALPGAAVLIGVTVLLGSAMLLGAAVLLAPAASAQEQPPDMLGVPDSVFAQPEHTPVSYSTTYTRATTTTSWNQTLSWSLSRKWLSVSTDASSEADRFLQDLPGGSTGGQFNGQLSMRPLPKLVFSTLGRFESVIPRAKLSDSFQNRNHIQLQGQYEVDPFSTLMIRTILSTDFRQDYDRSLRQNGNTFRSASTGETLTADSLLTHGRTTARQDGASAQIQWKPVGFLSANLTGSVNRSRPSTRVDSTVTGLYTAAGAPGRLHFAQTLEQPVSDTRAQANLGYSGPHGLKIGTQFQTTQSGHIYFASDLVGTENWTLDDRKGTLHVEHAPIPGLVYTIDGGLSRTFNGFTNRITQTSLVKKKTVLANFNWIRPGTNLSLSFNVENSNLEGQLLKDGSPDSTRNGETLFRFLSGNASRRLSQRLTVDGAASASLNSYSYVKPIGDQDLASAFASIGGLYNVSPQCSLKVHFTARRAINRYIDASQSANSNVTSDYAILAELDVRASRRMTIVQNYYLSASYRVADNPGQESFTTNSLSRNRRVDTTAADTLFPFAFVRLVHNFTYSDGGPYIREEVGQDRRFIVTNETYTQALEGAVGVKPITGVLFLLSQRLGNARSHTLATGQRTNQNSWNLTGSVEFDRPLPGGAAIRGAIRHIGEYTEGVPASRDDRWEAGVTLQRDFF